MGMDTAATVMDGVRTRDTETVGTVMGTRTNFRIADTDIATGITTTDTAVTDEFTDRWASECTTPMVTVGNDLPNQEVTAIGWRGSFSRMTQIAGDSMKSKRNRMARGNVVHFESSSQQCSERALAQDDDLVQRVVARLQDRLGSAVRDFQMSTHEGGLVLRGQVSSYYCKQLVQVVVMEVSGLTIQTNDVEVQCT